MSQDQLNIEHFEELLAYLRDAGHVAPNENPRLAILPGGVSNRTVLVDRPDGRSFVVKQALRRLRVATDWRSHPRRIEREALGLQWLGQWAPSGTSPTLLFLDREHHLLAMDAVPSPHSNWKEDLLSGKVQPEYIEQFGRLLGTIHQRSREREAEVSTLFADQTFFETLRLEPYYRYVAMTVPGTAEFLDALVEETRAQRLALVHGDYSPKNILIYQRRLVLLDHEVIHFGDPAFDVGFSTTHFLSKAHHLPGSRQRLLAASHSYWQTYQAAAPDLVRLPGFAARVTRHLLACMLARVAGRSPLEYLNSEERQRQQAILLQLLREAPETPDEFITSFQQHLP